MRSLVVLALAASLALLGCASTPSPWTCAAIGAALGGGGGAAYGADNNKNHDGDAIAGYGALGLLVGAGAGYGICYALQDREEEAPPPPPPPPPAPKPAPAPAPAPPPGPDPCRERITFEGVHFDFDKDDIRPDGRRLLDGVAARLDECREIRVEVAGHTDSVGSDVYNQGLSERRAGAVRDYLVGRGLSAGRFQTVGHGESQPVADNATKEGRAANRRVELTPLR